MLVTLFDGVEALDVTGPLGVLASANAWLAATTPGQTAYRIASASPGGVPVDGLSGVTLGADGDLAAAAAPHTLIVPGGTRPSCDETRAALGRTGTARPANARG